MAKASPGTANSESAGLSGKLRSLFRDTFLGVNNWFAPGEPTTPVQPEDLPRQQQIQPGYNLIYTPRAGRSTSFEQLRYFGNNYDVARTCVDIRIDEMLGLDWTIVPKGAEDGGSKTADDARVKKAVAFFEMPDPEARLDWQSWMRMLLEDNLIIDAATLFIRRTRKGEVYGFWPLDGALIKPLVDLQGRAPSPPAPAYQQVLFGTPRSIWTTDEIIYAPEHRRTHDVYGRSPIEGILYRVNTALRKQMLDLNHFTSGNTPQAFMGVPEGWTVTQMQHYQQYLDETLGGDLVRRSGIILAPGGGRGAQLPIHEFSPFEGNPEYEKWLLTMTCAAFHVTPAEYGVTDDVNRSTGEGQEDVQQRKGILPKARWTKSLVDRLLRDYMGMPDLEFKWLFQEKDDSYQQAQTHHIYLTDGVLDSDEVRQEIGYDPRPGNKPFVALPQQNITLVSEIGQAPEVPPALAGGGAYPGDRAGSEPEPGDDNRPDDNQGAADEPSGAQNGGGDALEAPAGDAAKALAPPWGLEPIGGPETPPTEPAGRVSMAEADYHAPALLSEGACQACAMFRAPGGCTLVLGAIDPAGHCRYWEAATAKAAGTAYDNASSQLDLTTSAAAEVIDFGKTIPDADLAPDGRETDPHVTLQYGLTGDDPVAEVRKAVRDFGKLPVFRFGQTRYFSASDYDVVYVPIEDAHDVLLLKNVLAEQTSHLPDTHPTYTPHVTVAYVKPGLGKKYVGRDVVNRAIEVGSVTVSDRRGRKTLVPIGFDTEKAAAYQAARDDLRRWRAFVLKRLAKGEPLRAFDTTAVPEAVRAAVADALDGLGAHPFHERADRARLAFKTALDVLNKGEGG